ncbi:MAG: hypothetical protein M3036_10200, partial [Bifidobacteriales bacterium]|nr:hypothetical protein [Bifidobacteriales bacterium]
MGGVAGFSACSLLALSRLGHAKGAARSEQGNLAVKQAVAAHSASVSDSATGDATTPMGPMPTSARWAYILDSTTNTVLLSRNAEERMPPSSLTKMMTAYVV